MQFGSLLHETFREHLQPTSNAEKRRILDKLLESVKYDIQITDPYFTRLANCEIKKRIYAEVIWYERTLG